MIQTQTVPAVVLGFHHGGLGIARSLGRMGVRVYGVGADPAAPAFASRYCRGRFAWSFRDEDARRSVDFLLDLGRRIGSPALLIPTSDDLAMLVAEHADALESRFLFQRQDPALVRALSDKRELYHLCRRHGVPTPETLVPTSRAELFAFLAQTRFPVVLKGIDGLRLEARTGRKMVIVASPDELLDWYDRLEDPAHPNLMLQEYIPGGDDTVWMFNGYFDGDSECVAAFTGRKLRQHPIHTGSTSLGVCEHNDEVVALTSRFMKAIGYRGILDIGYRYDARDGLYKLLDPNPRIGSTFRLFVGADGMDVVRYLLLDLTGRPLPRSRTLQGRKWLVEDQDLESALEYAREGSLSLRDWLRSLRGVREGAWFAADDPVPALRVGWALARRAARRGWRSILPAPRGSRPAAPPLEEPSH